MLFAYAPANLMCIRLFFIHESWLFCVCHITPDYPLLITYPCIISSLHLISYYYGYVSSKHLYTPRHPMGKYK